jgi:hypothetical protein
MTGVEPPARFHPMRRDASVRPMPIGRGSGGAAVLALVLTGCDPVINVFGSFFPAWVICIAAGITLAALVRPLLVLTRLEPQLGPLLIVYPSLALLLTMVTWLIFFHT